MIFPIIRNYRLVLIVYNHNFLINITYFFIFAVAWVALLGFGSPILIISGILFGKWIGTIVSVISMSLGALAFTQLLVFSLVIL